MSDGRAAPAATTRSTRARGATRKGSGPRRAQAIDWYEPATTSSTGRRRLRRWFADAVCNTCYNAVDRHVERGHGDAGRDHPRLAGHRHEARITYAELLARVRRSPARCRRAAWRRATGSSSTCRWCPRRWSRCSPAPGSARSIRWCSAASPRPSSRSASTTRKPKADHRRLLRHRAGPGRRLQAAGRRGDRAGAAQARGLPGPAARRRREAELDRGPRPRLGTRRRQARGARRPACRSAARTRSTSSTPPARPASPKGVVRDNGGHMVALAWTMKNIYGVEPGEVFWAASDVGWVVGHSYIVYAPLLAGGDHHRLRGQAGRHAGRRHVLAGDRRARGARASSPRRPRSARSSGRTRQGKLIARLRPVALAHLFLAGERADPDTIEWARAAARRCR